MSGAGPAGTAGVEGVVALAQVVLVTEMPFQATSPPGVRFFPRSCGLFWSLHPCKPSPGCRAGPSLSSVRQAKG